MKFFSFIRNNWPPFAIVLLYIVMVVAGTLAFTDRVEREEVWLKRNKQCVLQAMDRGLNKCSSYHYCAIKEGSKLPFYCDYP